MRGSLFRRISTVLCLLLTACPVLGEPQAAFLEVRLDRSVVRLEAELPYSGPQDQRTLREAAEREVGEVFTVGTGGGPPLPGQLKEVGVAPGRRRDEVSGEALGEYPKQTCLRAVWEYPSSANSDRLVFHSEIKQPVFFVTHHLGVRLHDRAPLKTEQTLDLDWEDPWYSRFLPNELTRTPRESIACYLYLEPGQTRLEVVARVRDLQPLGPLELGPDPLLSTDRQATVGKQVGEILGSRSAVWVNDRALDLQLEKVEFVRRTPTSADTLDPPQPVPVQSATVGALFLGPAVTEEGKLKLRSQLFGPRVREIPATVIEGDQVRKVTLLPDADGLIALAARPKEKVLKPVIAPKGAGRGILLALACGVLALGGFLMVAFRTRNGVFFVGMVLWVLAGVSALKLGWGPEKTVVKTRLQSLLGNIYQAFEAPTEEAVYDRLAVSVEGELLSQVYLQTRKGLEAEKGVQVAVERVEVDSATVASGDWWGDGMRVRALWQVSGSVGHWGHEHQRTNWYKAELKLKSVGGDWKLTELEVLDEIRM